MFQNFLNNLTNNLKKTSEQLSKNIKKEDISKKYMDFIKNPKIQKYTNVNPNEYNQQMRYFKQTIINKKKEFEEEFNELKKKKPEDLVNYFHKIDIYFK